MDILLPAFYLTSGLLLFVGVQCLFFAVFGVFRGVIGYFSLMCFSASAYQLASALYLSAESLDQSLRYLHWQVFALATFFPTYIGFVGHYTRDDNTRLWLIPAVAYSVILVIADNYLAYGLRYEFIRGLDEVLLPWGEAVSIIDGRLGSGISVINLIAIVIIVWGGYRAIVLKNSDRSQSAVIFLLALCVFLAFVIYALAANHGLLPQVYISGFGFLALTLLMAANIAIDIRKSRDLVGVQKKQLIKEQSISGVLRQNQARLSQVVAQSPHGIYLIDKKGRLIQRNHASRKFYNDGLESLDAFFQKPPWNNLGLEQRVLDSMQTGNAFSLLAEIPKEALKDSRRNAWVRLTIFPISESSGFTDAVALISEDTTNQYLIDSALKALASGVSFAESRAYYQRITLQLTRLLDVEYAFVASVNSTNFSLLALCKNGDFLDKFSDQLSGSFLERIVGRHLIVYPEGVQNIFPSDKVLEEWGIESLIAAPLSSNDGSTIGVLAALDTKRTEFGDDLQVVFETIVARTGAELQREDAEARIQRMAYEDYITRLPNRALLNESLIELTRDCSRSGCIAAAYFLDIDHFKTINDALGHDIGDDVLRRVGSRLRASFEEEIIVARMGGDEFVLLERISNDPLSEEEVIARVKETGKRIKEVMSRPLSLGNRILSLGTSIGIVIIPHHAENELAVIGRADIALYEAKQAGRNRYEIYDPEMQRDVDERLEIEKGLRTGLKENHFLVYYQPKVDVQGKVVGAEALLRWNHPEHGFISPAKFIPVAEETGLIHLIGEWVLEAICEQLALWKKQGVDFPGDMSVNISAWQFARQDFIKQVNEILERYGLSEKNISIEMTETAILRDINDTKDKLLTLREQGFSIALDDFGTGYSSLAYLKDLPVDSFKIDRGFVEDIKNRQTEGLLRSMIAIGRHMNLNVIAEGIETEEERDKLIEMGCEFFQGYLFGHPMPADDFVQWMKENV